MLNGHAKTNGHAGPAKAAPPSSPKQAKPPPPPADPLAFADEFPTKVRALVETAEKNAKADVQRIGDSRYAEGLRRGAFLISMVVGSLDGPAKERVARALEQLEEETEKAVKALRK